MFGAIYIGLSGLGAYARGLKQVSNNVANLNSTGFKASTVSFTNMVSGNTRGGLTYTGGDASGQGVSVSDSRLNFTPGELRQTGRDLDLAIDGSGFLVLQKGAETAYVRTGSFEVDPDGYIVLAGTDYRLATLDSAGQPVTLSVDLSRTSAPVATKTVKLSDNLSSSATSHVISGIKVYDAAGGEHIWQIKFDKDTNTGPESWKVTVTDDKSKTVGASAISFNAGVINAATSKLLLADTDYPGLSVEIDLSQGVTSFSSGEISTLRKNTSDGHGAGTIASVSVNAKGHLEIGYSNQQKVDLGAIAIADFRSPQSLQQLSDGLFTETGMGQRELMSSQDARVGQVVSKQLEASNVDLSQQFGDLILIQRGFQASSQIVSVSNDMIQQLFGIRGQG